MLAALTLIVLVGAGDEPAQLALHDAAQTVLGEQANVAVRGVAALPSDDAAVELLHVEHADAIATVAWLDREQQHAAVHVFRAAQNDLLRRELEFGPTDTALEKARSLGLAIASMLLPEPEAAEPAKPPEAPAAQPAVPPPPEVAASPRAQPAPPSPMPSAERPLAPPARGSSLTASMDVAASGLLALGGTGTRAGGGLGAQLAGKSHFGLRMDLGMSIGHVAQLDADLLVLDLAPGVVWLSATSPAAHPLSLELQLSVVARYLAASRSADSTHPQEQHARWLPAARLGAVGVFWFSSEFALLADAGLDCSMGETSLLAMGARKAKIEPLALFLMVGARARL